MVVTLADDIRALPKELGQKKFGLDWVYLTLTCPAKLIQAGLEDSTFAVVRSPVNGPFTTYQYRLKRFNTRGRISARPMPDRIPAGAARCEKIPVAERRGARRGAPLRRGEAYPCASTVLLFRSPDGRVRWVMRAFPPVSSEQVWPFPKAFETRSVSSRSERCAAGSH